jgi:chaperonin cofactor prefoldin
MIGETYADLSKESADERLEALKEKLQEQISSIENEQNEIKISMATLKVKLYGKFKNSINLEED